MKIMREKEVSKKKSTIVHQVCLASISLGVLVSLNGKFMMFLNMIRCLVLNTRHFIDVAIH